MKKPLQGETPPLFPVELADDAQVASCRTIYAREGLSPRCRKAFQGAILNYYQQYGRRFPWRDEITPYRVLVSEIMLQQTQTYRVEPKFTAFLARFPDPYTLAHAPFNEVLALWKGLGYNRRALHLHAIAKQLVADHQGLLPQDPDTLQGFPGIGKATAASICVFAYNQARVFIETNIRTVFIYFFFADTSDISDARIMPLIEQSLETTDPRTWYYALMDYGVMLKKQVGNLNRHSTHYRKQSAFTGSNRQIRGQILQALLESPRLNRVELAAQLGCERSRLDPLVEALCREGFIQAMK